VCEPAVDQRVDDGRILGLMGGAGELVTPTLEVRLVA
jgi:hypothetical protein